MKESLQNAITDELPEADYPEFEPGDKIKVTSSKEIRGQQRKRHFEGICIARRGEGPDETFKVRKVSFGVGVERIFPLYSPAIDDVEILRKGKVRRAKLNYLEGRSAKESRIDEERVDLEEVNRTRKQAAKQADVEAEEEVGEESVSEDEEQEENDQEVGENQVVDESSNEDEPEGADNSTETAASEDTDDEDTVDDGKDE